MVLLGIVYTAVRMLEKNLSNLRTKKRNYLTLLALKTYTKKVTKNFWNYLTLLTKKF